MKSYTLNNSKYIIKPIIIHKIKEFHYSILLYYMNLFFLFFIFISLTWINNTIIIII